MNDLELLRAYEPVLRFTYGELFFPCDIAGYVEHCALYMAGPDSDSSELVIDRGELTLERLDELRPPPPGHQHYLRFVDRPLEGPELARWLIREDRPVFNARGRLAHVGLGIRALDSTFELLSLLRGRVPGGTVAAAEVQYQRVRQRHPGYSYAGRVVRAGGYVTLQYMFFYAINDWRTSFHGVNDHEADWEQVFIYLEETPDGYRPLWVAGSVHAFAGEDLRRRWDDPALEWRGNHPIVYTAAGSHANYLRPGEYLARYEVGPFKPISRFIDQVRRLWTQSLRQGDPTLIGERIAGLLRFPYVDYARGDGLAVGPGEEEEWTPVLVTADDAWIEHYQGLWGLRTTDPLEGESAPTGPKFNRNGTIRQTWADPVGWTGLHKVATPGEARQQVEDRLAEIHQDLKLAEERIQELEVSLSQLGLEVDALQRSGAYESIRDRRRRTLLDDETEMNRLVARRSDLRQAAEALDSHLQRIDEGDMGDPTAHVRQFHVPLSDEEIKESRIVETWAAVSVGLLLFGFLLFLVFFREIWIVGVAGMVFAFVGIDTALRRHLTDLLVATSVVLALLSLGVLLYEFFFETVVVVVALLSLVIIIDNFREIRGR